MSGRRVLRPLRRGGALRLERRFRPLLHLRQRLDGLVQVQRQLREQGVGGEFAPAQAAGNSVHPVLLQGGSGGAGELALRRAVERFAARRQQGSLGERSSEGTSK